MVEIPGEILGEEKLPYKMAAMAGGVPGGMLWKKLPRLRVSEEAFFRAGSRRAWGKGFSGGFGGCGSDPFRNFQNEPPGIFPAQAGVGDGFAVGTFADFLAAFFNVAFDHDAPDEVL